MLPPWQSIEVLSRRGGIAAGARTILRVPVGPLRLTWSAVHRASEEGTGFIDEQTRGPFRRWQHSHFLEPHGPERCILRDHVAYELPLGGLGLLAAGGYVARELDRLFTYRHAVLQGDMALLARLPEASPLRIAVTGASGMIGRALRPLLTSMGHEVVSVVRRRPREQEIFWKPSQGTVEAAAFEGVDAVIHLAGENIAGSRWSESVKQRIRQSRVRGTKLLAETLASLERPPRVLISASGINYFGDRGDELLPDDAPGGRGFLPEVVRGWEDGARAADAAGIRTVHLRFGPVFTPAGGFLDRLMLPFRLGLGGKIGAGQQWVSWVAIDDVVGGIYWALMNESLAGGINLAAPEPVRNEELTRTLARVLHRPAPFTVPPAALRLALGREMADELVLSSVRAVPRRLLDSGYRFRYPHLEPALRHLLGRENGSGVP